MHRSACQRCTIPGRFSRRSAIMLAALAGAACAITAAWWIAECQAADAPAITRTAGPGAEVTRGSPASTDIVLRPVRWQALPADIKEAVIGPDRRVWLVAPYARSPIDLDTVKQSIQEQFRKPSPRIIGARPVLFETSGRVWFVTTDGQTLLGYLPADVRLSGAAANPEPWIERHPEGPQKFVGGCPDQATAQPWNLQLGERCLFPDSGGIHGFDGKQWSYQSFSSPGDEPPPKGKQRLIVLVRQPDGGGAMALFVGFKTPLWFWRAGATGAAGVGTGAGQVKQTSAGVLKWQALDSPPSLRGEKLTGIAPLASDRLILTAADGRMAVMKLDLIGGKIPADFDKLVAELGDSDYKVRESASARLAAMGEQIQPLLQKALEKATDPEVKNRLETAIGQVVPRGDRGQALGACRVTRTLSLISAGDGSSVMAALAYDEPAGGNGNTDPTDYPAPELRLLTIDSRGAVRSMNVKRPGRDESWDASSYSFWQTMTWLETSRSVWLTGANAKDGPSLKIDLSNEQAVIAMLPDPTLPRLCAYRPAAIPADAATQRAAADSDAAPTTGRPNAGTLESSEIFFLASGDLADRKAMPIVVYQPEAPDDRLPLLSQSKTIRRNTPWCVASDGAVWCQGESGDIERFDGRQWQSVAELHDQCVQNFVPGAGGSVLAEVPQVRFLLFSGRNIFENRNLANLIKDHKSDFAAAFHGRTPSEYWPWGTAVVADNTGNIWLLGDQKLFVLVGDQWLEADEPLQAAAKDAASRGGAAGEKSGGASGADTDEAGSPARLACLALAGDGTSVFASNLFPGDRGGISFFGKVDHGKLVFTVAPPARAAAPNPSYIYDQAGSLWVGGTAADTHTSVSTQNPEPAPVNAPPGLLAQCASADVLTQLYVGSGLPRLCDKSGNLWLVQPAGPATTRLAVGRDGQVIDTLILPCSDPFVPVISDQPGSVFIWTPLGLRHYTEQAALAGSPAAANKLPSGRWLLRQSFQPREESSGNDVRFFQSDAFLVDYCPLGYIVTDSRVRGEADSSHDLLHLIPVPGSRPSTTQPARFKALETQPATGPAAVPELELPMPPLLPMILP